MVVFIREGVHMCLAQVQHNSKLIIRTGNLIILYHCTYSGLLGTAGVVIWTPWDLMRSAGSGPLVDG